MRAGPQSRGRIYRGTALHDKELEAAGIWGSRKNAAQRGDSLHSGKREWQWHTPVISVTQKLRQEDREFQVSLSNLDKALSNLVRTCVKIKNKKNGLEFSLWYPQDRKMENKRKKEKENIGVADRVHCYPGSLGHQP